jgi:hypothetical protein
MIEAWTTSIGREAEAARSLVKAVGDPPVVPKSVAKER